MSSHSIATLRKSSRGVISKLVEEHLQHDLRDSDRDAFRKSASKLTRHAVFSSLLGLGLGVFMAFRIRSARTIIFNAFRGKKRPTRVQFADGRIGAFLYLPLVSSLELIPDITPMLKPTILGDVATYLFFSAGGLFLGGETGLLTGLYSATRTFPKGADARTRIKKAFRKSRVDFDEEGSGSVGGGGERFG
ncbi:MAG: hypothetical protein Q9164_004920 [Protoblastenia rupestris]